MSASTSSNLNSEDRGGPRRGRELREVGSEQWRRQIEGPFRRLDPNPDAFELARLALCALTIVPLRTLLIGVFLPSYYICSLSFISLAPDTMWAQAVSIFFIRMASRFLLLLLGFWKVDVRGLEENAGRKDEPRVFVSNHIGYAEILYFLYALGPSFVMKQTCLRVPLIGSIAARIIDCVPVDNKGGKVGGSGTEAIAARLRRMFGEEALANGIVGPRQQEGGQKAKEEGSPSDTGGNAATKSRLPTAEENWARGWKGNPLLLFPEGTTSNGSCLLRFKTGVFAGGVPVHPVTVKFDSQRFSPAFESIYFPIHAFRTLAEPAHHMTVEYLPRFDPTPEQRADRALYAKAVQKVFCDATGLPAVEAGYSEKTEYHTYLRKEFMRHPWGGFALLLPAPDRHRVMLESGARHSGGHGEVGAIEGGDASMAVRRAGTSSGTVAHEGASEGKGGVAVGASAVAAGDGSCCAGGEAALRRRVGQASFVAPAGALSSVMSGQRSSCRGHQQRCYTSRRPREALCMTEEVTAAEEAEVGEAVVVEEGSATAAAAEDAGKEKGKRSGSNREDLYKNQPKPPKKKPLTPAEKEYLDKMANAPIIYKRIPEQEFYPSVGYESSYPTLQDSLKEAYTGDSTANEDGKEEILMRVVVVGGREEEGEFLRNLSEKGAGKLVDGLYALWDPREGELSEKIASVNLINVHELGAIKSKDPVEVAKHAYFMAANMLVAVDKHPSYGDDFVPSLKKAALDKGLTFVGPDLAAKVAKGNMEDFTKLVQATREALREE
eukprot:g8114.t1